MLIQENADPEVQTDLTAFFHRLVPPTTDPAMSYLTHTCEGPDDMPGHIKAALWIETFDPTPEEIEAWMTDREPALRDGLHSAPDYVDETDPRGI